MLGLWAFVRLIRQLLKLLQNGKKQDIYYTLYGEEKRLIWELDF